MVLFVYSLVPGNNLHFHGLCVLRQINDETMQIIWNNKEEEKTYKPWTCTNNANKI